ncbi:DUF2339 domain-containing protein [Paenibacillus mendelii]|uniref:DUF2339 domain-containing protein n=1 Tax=Paenibacillus mendelii TaxID=206163 RepID=A0ABV6JJJ7_9BACL|nr:DUF2339 domain-containing protein [Paenibacillus mendelii]MCQ6559023.1 DUF2339 domain-containing protein [Paenibacillus mendelii]
MLNVWKRHWTTFVGSLFMLASLLTLFKYTSDQGLLTDPIKIGIGLLAGAAFAAVGLTLFGFRRGGNPIGTRRMAGEIGTGLGAAIWYSTCSYAGVYTALWDSLVVMLVMIAITAALSFIAYSFHSRMLMAVGLGGAMLAPLVMRPDTDQIFTLFLYLFVVNTAFFLISLIKSWVELRTAAFILTWILYGVYYLQMDPELGGWWSMPVRYAVAAFLFYAIAFYAAAWREKCSFAGLNVYFSFANTVLFGLWMSVLLDGRAQVTIVLTVIGLLYLALAGFVHRSEGEKSLSFTIHAAFGGLALLIGLAGLGSGSEIRPMIGVYVWAGVAGGLLALGSKLRSDVLKGAATLVWLCTGIYWFVTSWDVPRLNWFGTFVPFLNGGALAWIALAAFGFYCARAIHYGVADKQTNAIFANVYALFAHWVVGGLLTVQIKSLYEEQNIAGSLNLTLSAVWGVYALLLFVWGAYSRQRLFRWFGSIVLVLVSLKAVFIDMSNTDTIYKMIVFVVLGAISFLISWVNNRWQGQEAEQQPTAEAGAGLLPEEAINRIRSAIQAGSTKDKPDL